MSIYSNGMSYINITGFYALNLNRFQMDMHLHQACEIMCLTAGSCTIALKGEYIHLKERQFIFVDALVPHQLIVEEGQLCSLLNLEFVCSREHGEFKIEELQTNSSSYQDFIHKKKEFIVMEDTQKLSYALKDLINVLDKKEQQDLYMRKLLFSRMMLELANCDQNQKSGQGQVYLKRAREYIRQHLDEELYVKDIASFIGINHSYLQTLFSSNEHCGMNAYINRLRMEKSSFLLKNSQMAIVDIALEMGFNSRQHFGYTFQKHFKVSPKKYRQLYGQHIYADTKTSQLIKDDKGEFLAYPIV